VPCWHLFMEGGRFQPEVIVAMRTAYEASLKELRDAPLARADQRALRRGLSRWPGK
jgi:hypothetical protein